MRLGHDAPPAKTQGKAHRVALTAALVLGLAAVMGVVTLPNRYPEHPQTPPTAVQAQRAEPAPAPKRPEPDVAAPKAAEPSAAMLVTATPASKTPAQSAVAGGVLEQVLPEVLPSARHTIQGTVKVAVKVRVDPAGSVEDAQLTTHGPSKYFAARALEAARRWKFNPPRVSDQAVASDWLLHFEFSRSDTKVRPQEVRQ